MRIISSKTLREYWESHAGVETALKLWCKRAEDAEWKSPDHVKLDYPSADILPNNRVVFNIKGNHYRLVVKIHYNTGTLFVRFVGTHAEYSKIDAEKK